MHAQATKKLKLTKNSSKKPFHDVELPQDMVAEILSFIPSVKALIRLSCVCKSWLKLIRSPKFIKTHLDKSTNNYTTHQRLIICHSNVHSFYDTTPSYYMKSLGFDINENNASVLDYPTHESPGFNMIIGSCNGLVCIAVDQRGIFLWNPSTKMFKELPNLDRKLPQLWFLSNIRGLGYDHLSDDYKVVWGSDDHVSINVYSLKSNSWCKIRDFPYSGFPMDMGIFVNGALHWMVSQDITNCFLMKIVSFNVKNHTYGEIVLPRYGKAYVYSLSILDGFLSFACHASCNENIYDDTVTQMDIWVMKEYNVSDTWIKVFSITYNTKEFCNGLPLLFTKTGEILFHSSNGLVLYNPHSASFRDPNIGNLSGMLCGLSACTYIESLVSPNIDDLVPESTMVS